MKTILICIIGTIIFNPFFVNASGWKSETKICVITDETKKTAHICNKSGHCFTIYRLGKEIWANFSLSETCIDTLSPNRFIIMTVDKNEPYDLNSLRKMAVMTGEINYALPGANLDAEEQRRNFEIQPKWVNFQLYDHPYFAESELPKETTLRELIDGEEMVIRYFLLSGGYKETYFSLKGSKDAIIEFGKYY
jgi:hypothetical protein